MTESNVTEFKTIDQQNLENLTKALNEVCVAYKEQDERVDILNYMTNCVKGEQGPTHVGIPYTTVRINVQKHLPAPFIINLCDRILHTLTLEPIPTVRSVKFEHFKDEFGKDQTAISLRLILNELERGTNE